MKHSGFFKFLKVEQMNRKDNGKEFMVMHVLDEENNPARFFIFNEGLINKLRDINPSSLQEIEVSYNVVCGEKGWNVNIVDIN